MHHPKAAILFAAVLTLGVLVAVLVSRREPLT